MCYQSYLYQQAQTLTNEFHLLKHRPRNVLLLRHFEHQRKIEDLAIIFNDPELLAVSSFEEEGEELSSDFNENDIDDFIEMLLDKDYSSD